MKLYDKLKNYSKKNILAMHMPGHKRKKHILKNCIPYQIDITEIDGFDNLYDCNDILKECQDRVTKLYSTKQSFYLVNGSTSGILSAISTFCHIGDKIILPRNCHKSVYNIIDLLNLKCAFVPISVDENGICKDLDVENLENVIKKNLDAKCVILTSPTYEGVISNIKNISEVVHKYNLKLIVDEAHGAHLFLDSKSAVQNGADIVINSLHKTLPSLTQTAVLHVCSDNVDICEVKKKIATFNSSSPSYILMAGMDECICFMQEKGQQYFNKLRENLNLFYTLTKSLRHLKILEKNTNNNFYDFDMTKIVVTTTNCNITGYDLMELLRQNKIEVEMAYVNYVICMTTIFDSKKDIIKLAKVLLKIDKNLDTTIKNNYYYNFSGTIKMDIAKASYSSKKEIDFKNSIGKVCSEFVWVYPPGVPILVPGELISEEIYQYLNYVTENKLNLHSTSGKIQSNKIFVLDNDKKYM